MIIWCRIQVIINPFLGSERGCYRQPADGAISWNFWWGSGTTVRIGIWPGTGTGRSDGKFRLSWQLSVPKQHRGNYGESSGENFQLKFKNEYKKQFCYYNRHFKKMFMMISFWKRSPFINRKTIFTFFYFYLKKEKGKKLWGVCFFICRRFLLGGCTLS